MQNLSFLLSAVRSILVGNMYLIISGKKIILKKSQSTPLTIEIHIYDECADALYYILANQSDLWRMQIS